jgi:hypothetical protein
MKQLLATDTPGSYAFDKTAKTVTFSGLRESITLSNILLITNVTANTIIYNFADSTKGAVSFNNNVLTLDYDTSSMANTDVLQIFLDVPSNEESLHDLLRRMNKLLESNAVVDSSLRQRVTLDAIGSTPTALTTTVPVSGTVTAIISPGAGNISTNSILIPTTTNPYTLASGSFSTGFVMEGPVHQLWRIADDSRNLYASAIRSKLSFS